MYSVSNIIAYLISSPLHTSHEQYHPGNAKKAAEIIDLS